MGRIIEYLIVHIPCFKIHVTHPKKVVRNREGANLLFQEQLAGLRVSKVLNIILLTCRPQRPLIFIECWIVTEGSGKGLRLKLNFQIDSQFKIQRSRISTAPPLRGGIFQLIVKVSPDAGINPRFRRESDTGSLGGKESNLDFRDNTGFQSHGAHDVEGKLIVLFHHVDHIAGHILSKDFNGIGISLCIFIVEVASYRDVHIH